MGGYSELIKNLSKTRDYIRDFFIYGYKSRNDFTNKSARTYDDERRRIESWLGDNIRHDDSVSGRMISISVDSGHILTNPLYKAYYSSSFTDNDIWLHFCILDILSDGKWCTLDEIDARLFDMLVRERELTSKQTIRNKLKEYAEEGIILCERKDKTDRFRISPDEADDYMRRFSGLDDALRFFSCCTEFGVIGSTIMNAVDIENEHFLMKHNYIVHTLEDEVVLKFIEAIDKKCVVEVTRFNKTAGEESSSKKVIPMQILISLQTGRRYAAVWDAEFARFTSMRLDFIKDVKQCEVCREYDGYYSEYIERAAHSFGVSFHTQENDLKLEPLRITVSLDEKNEKYILNRLVREKRCGVLEHIGENLYSLTFDVYDPNEIMQWVKSLMGRVVSIEGGTENVRGKFVDDIRRMKEMYGGENGNIQ